jgi:hypothetical protein
VLLGRFDLFALRAALLGVVFGACHAPSGTSSVAPLSSAPLAQPGRTSATAGASQGGSSAENTGSASEAVAGGGLRDGATALAPALAPDAGSAVPVAGSADTHASPGGEVALPLVDAQGKPLPQTEQRPSTTTAAFRQRIEAVAAAIISGDAEPAFVSFFPLVAYAQVKDVAKPERDYKFRLLANFKRDVLEYHHALGAEAAQAKLSGVTVSEKDAKWMEPGSEGNKLGYFRVLRSRLHFTLPAGRSRDFELTSLISWRGEWYVVHLHGFK